MAACVAEGIGFAVDGRVVVLYAAIVAGGDEFAGVVEDGGTDGDAAFGEAFAGFGDGDGEHGVRVGSGHAERVQEMMGVMKRRRN